MKTLETIYNTLSRLTILERSEVGKSGVDLDILPKVLSAGALRTLPLRQRTVWAYRMEK